MAILARKATDGPPPPASPTEEAHERPWLLLLLAIAALALAALVALGLGERASERRALEAVEPAQRRELYEDVRRASMTLCERARSNDAFEDRCVELIDLLLAFPECDDACRTFAATHQRAPTR